MNQSSEPLLLGILARHPSSRSLIPPSAFVRKEYKEMAQEIYTWYENHPYTPCGLHMLLQNERRSSFTVQSIIDFCERTMPREEEEALRTVQYLLQKVEDDKHITETLQKVEDAKALIASGNYNVGAALLKRIPFRFEADGDFSSTADLMVESVYESNGFRSGIPAIDEYTGGWYMGNILSIAGDTGSQKTRSSLWILIQVLKANPTFKAVFFEKEMPIKDVSRMLVGHFCQIPNDHIIKSTPEERERIAKEIEETTKREDVQSIISRIKLVGPTEFNSVTDMWRITERFKANVWVLDYMSLLDEGAKSSGEKAYTVMSNMATLKNMCNATGTFGIILNQLNKGTVEHRINKIPSMDDIEWSGDIKKLSAYVLATFFPGNYYSNVPKKYFYLISLKNRDKQNYTVPLLSLPEYTQFSYPDAEKQDMVDYITEYKQISK